MTTYLVAVSAIVPSLLLVWYFHSHDAYPEPPRVLWTTFLLGIVAVIPAAIIEIVIEPFLGGTGSYFAYGALDAFLAAAIPEELCKLAVLLGYSMRRSEFNEPMDGIVYGAVASLGFATIENVLYVWDAGTAVAIMRGLTAIPGHAFMGAIMGYFVGRARFSSDHRTGLILAGLGGAILAHGLYDFPVLTLKALSDGTPSLPPVQNDAVGLLFFATVAVLVVEWQITVRLVHRARLAQAGPASTIILPAPSGVPASSAPSTPTAPAAPAATTGPSSSLWGALLVVGGGLLATGGGMVALAVLVAFAIGAVEPIDASYTIAGGLLIGLLPLAVGAFGFIQGVQRLNRGHRRPANG